MEERRHDQLGNALTHVNGRRGCAVVMERDHDLAAVIGVDDTDLIRRGEPALTGKPAPRVDQSCVSLRQFQRKPGVYEHRLSRGNRQRRVQKRIKVGARGTRGAVSGQDSVRIQFLDIYLYHVVLLILIRPWEGSREPEFLP